MNHQDINQEIARLPDTEKELVSDGYHTFKELYEHRVTLFVVLCNELCENHTYIEQSFSEIGEKYNRQYVWKSKLHYDGTMWDGWFIAGIGQKKGETLTYHIPISEWDNLNSFEISNAPEWDGHTSEDVLKLLREIK